MASASFASTSFPEIVPGVPAARMVSPLALATLAAVALVWPAAAAARTPTHVACVGDSITYGYGASSSNASYPSDLQKMLGSSVMVRNFGHSGATLLSVGDLPYQQQSEYAAATSFASGAGASAAVAVVIMLGTNDAKPQNWMSGGRAMQMRTDATALIDHFAQLGTHPTIYLAIPPRAYPNTFGIDGMVLHDQIEPLLREVAASKGVATIDVYTPTATDSKLFSDMVHPTDAGYTLLATIIRDALLNGAGGGGGSGGGGTAGASGGGGKGSAGTSGSAGASAGGRDGGSGGMSGGATGGTASGGATGSGGTSSGGTSSGGTGGTGSGGAATGGSATGAVGSGGAATGGGSATGGAGTGGMSAGTGGQVPTTTGGAMASSSGGSGGATATTGTGGSRSGGGETNGTDSGCSCVVGGGNGRVTVGAAILVFVLFLTRPRRRCARQAVRSGRDS